MLSRIDKLINEIRDHQQVLALQDAISEDLSREIANERDTILSLQSQLRKARSNGEGRPECFVGTDTPAAFFR